MSSDTQIIPATAGRRRSKRPERIDLGDDEAVRNDILAKEEGTAERTLNRADKHGAPFLFIGGVKYRPYRAYKQYLASRIQRKNQAEPQRGRRRSRTHA
jgi:hypothetical protein